jgi:hypothetical protein
MDDGPGRRDRELVVRVVDLLHGLDRAAQLVQVAAKREREAETLGLAREQLERAGREQEADVVVRGQRLVVARGRVRVRELPEEPLRPVLRLRVEQDPVRLRRVRSVRSKFGSPSVGMPSPSPASPVPCTPSAPTSLNSWNQSMSSSPVHQAPVRYAGRRAIGPYAATKREVS